MKVRKMALAAAVELLAQRAYTEKEIRDKLRRKAYEETEIEEAAETLKQRGYIDDVGLCHSLLDKYCNESNHSLQYIRAKLLQKGIAVEIVTETAEEFFDAEREYATALSALQRKYSSTGEMEPLSAAGYLYRKGFEVETIRRVIADFDGADETYVEL